jgi:hypothetical protein
MSRLRQIRGGDNQRRNNDGCISRFELQQLCETRPERRYSSSYIFRRNESNSPLVT